MRRLLLCLPILLAGAFLSGCGGEGQTYNQAATTAGPVGNFTIQLAEDDGVVHKRTGPITDLGDLDSVTGYPGFTNPIFGNFTDFLAISQNGFTGSITLADVSSTSPSHIPCLFSQTENGSPSSTLTVSPTQSGATFTVSFTVPANYNFASTTLQFKATDSSGREKTVEIPVTLVNFSASFSAGTFVTDFGSGTGTLAITPQDLYSGTVAVTFDTTILPSDNVPAAFNHPLPGNVTVTAPQAPVTLTHTPSITTPVNFTWTNLPPGQYTVIAVLTYPFDVAGAGIVQRVPCEISVSADET